MSPAGIMAKAVYHGLQALSITDHDTIAAYPEALAAAEKRGLALIPGVELSTVVEGRSVHVLAYGFDLRHPGLLAHLERFQEARIDRIHDMVGRLAHLGAPVSTERVLEIAGRGSVGRPHVAQALVEAGWARSVPGAFDLFIGDGAPAYVTKHDAAPEPAIEAIHAAGGVAVVAHPGWMDEAVLGRLLAAGLDGAEVVHPSHNAPLRARWTEICERHGLLPTGGSDYHGFRPIEDDRFGGYHAPAESVRRLLGLSRRPPA
jgi:predicted metal-dependent phosphoesterase TrpH